MLKKGSRQRRMEIEIKKKGSQVRVPVVDGHRFMSFCKEWPRGELEVVGDGWIYFFGL